MICFPTSKINIGLHVINKREDGFHNIETIFYPVGLSDILECVENTKYNIQDKCQFIASGLKISGDVNQNLVVKAYQVLDNDFDLPPVLVNLHKQVPMGAGLGGGSSDAAFMLSLLNDLFELRLTVPQLEKYASTLGSDCAFFIQNKPAYVFGKGHELTQIDISLAGLHLVLIHTGKHSSTAQAYAHVLKRGSLIPGETVKDAVQLPYKQWQFHLFNDFEPSVFKFIPELAKIKNWLYQQGAIYAAMSGSGSCMFGLFTDKPKLNGEFAAHVIHGEELK